MSEPVILGLIIHSLLALAAIIAATILGINHVITGDAVVAIIIAAAGIGSQGATAVIHNGATHTPSPGG